MKYLLQKLLVMRPSLVNKGCHFLIEACQFCFIKECAISITKDPCLKLRIGYATTSSHLIP